LKISHVISDGFSIQLVLIDLLKLYTNVTEDSFSLKKGREDHTLLTRLPVSLGFAYEHRYKPGREEAEEAIQYWAKVMSTHMTPSMAIGDTSADVASRPHKHSSARAYIDKEVLGQLKAIAKGLGVHVFALIASAYIRALVASHGIYSEVAEGIKLNFPLGTQRWVNSRQEKDRGPILCAPLAGLFYIPTDASKTLLGTARHIQSSITAQSNTPHALHPAGIESFVKPYVHAIKTMGDK
jgi:hypothetical protein